MKKIPTLFERDCNGDRSRVLDQINPEAQWVFDGEGIATRKHDGTCVLIEGNLVYKRYERKIANHATGELKPEPEGFREIDVDPVTLEIVGWVPADMSNPADRWLFDGLNNTVNANGGNWPDEGTYELVAPKVNANPDGHEEHIFLAHGDEPYIVAERSFDGFKMFFEENNIEGLVFHHPDGRMAKIKGKDFGIKRTSPVLAMIQQAADDEFGPSA